jgi:hypothetical protein
MCLSREYEQVLRRRIRKARTTEAPENAVGQWIAGFVEAGVLYYLESIMRELPSNEFSMRPPIGSKTWHLLNRYGEEKQIDHLISDKRGDPVLVIEDKWLKDQRHLKDKGSWIMVLKAVKEATPSLRGSIAVLAGDWNETTLGVLRKLSHVFYIPLKTVYDNLKDAGIEVRINRKRQAFEKPEELLERILSVVETKLDENVDIMTEVGKKIALCVAEQLKATIIELLYPKKPETALHYEFSITTSWGRVRLIEGKCISKNPDEIIEAVRGAVGQR